MYIRICICIYIYTYIYIYIYIYTGRYIDRQIDMGEDHLAIWSMSVRVVLQQYIKSIIIYITCIKQQIIYKITNTK